MLTEKDYCDYDTCVALEELGFPIRRIKVKGEEKNVPILLYEAQKWLREEKRINIFVAQIPIENSNNFRYMAYIQLGESAFMTPYSHTYEEALQEGLKEAVKILKK